MNWRYKALLQAVLSILPFGENINHQLQNIAGGNDPRYTKEAAVQIVEIMRLLSENGLSEIKGAEILEVGTGWQPNFAIIFSLLGAGKVYTYDHVRHIRFELVKEMLSQLEKEIPVMSKSLDIPAAGLREKCARAADIDNLTALFGYMDICYIAPGDASRTELPGDSIDLFFSTSVLEHIPERAIATVLKEAKRVLRSGGLCYNRIGLHDHYIRFDKNISPVNFLRYPESLWKMLAKNKITYMNRLRNSQFIDMFDRCGFEILNVKASVDRTALDVLKNMKLDKRFRNFDPEDLATTSSEILARKKEISHEKKRI